MIYFATVKHGVGVENDSQKLAVVSDLPRSLVMAHIIFPCVGFFFAWRNNMLQFLMCLFSFHGATEIEYTIDDEEIKVCRDCMKEVE